MSEQLNHDAPAVTTTPGRRPVPLQDGSATTSSSQQTAARVRGPIDPRLVRRGRATQGFLAAMVVAGGAAALLTIAQASLLADALAGTFAGKDAGPALAVCGPLLAVFAGRAVIAWLNQWLAHRAAASVKSTLRRDILAARLERPLDQGASAPALVTLVTQGLDALDGFYSKYLPQLVLAVVVPAIVGVAVLTHDVLSTVIVAVTLPLIPLFMALVGWTTQARTQKRWRLQTLLARHFADLIEGLPTLQVFGRARAQLEGLRVTEGRHRRETMVTLRISFLSALVLELLATLSVAIVAVSTGFRVLYGLMDLHTALFVLILAPEIYLPVRKVGAHYHDSADGMAAAAAAFALIDGDGSDGVAAPSAIGDTLNPRALVSVRSLGHTYPGASSPAVSGVSFDCAPGEFVVLTGPSGGGKTTVLNAVMGFVAPSTGTVWGGGRPILDDATAWRARVAYVGQDPGMLAGTVADNARLGDPHATDEAVRAALDAAGAAELGLDHGVGDDGEGLSAGERRRVAVARALLRMRSAGAELLVLDEPTAGLDADAEATLLASLRAQGAAAIVVSHRPAVIAQADRVVSIGGVQ